MRELGADALNCVSHSILMILMGVVGIASL